MEGGEGRSRKLDCKGKTQPHSPLFSVEVNGGGAQGHQRKERRPHIRGPVSPHIHVPLEPQNRAVSQNRRTCFRTWRQAHSALRKVPSPDGRPYEEDMGTPGSVAPQTVRGHMSVASKSVFLRPHSPRKENCACPTMDSKSVAPRSGFDLTSC